ncbi:hypothetical protein CYLTODRAFT_483174, partial [Cylindrobasidium torrendii FP15055 ss-10]
MGMFVRMSEARDRLLEENHRLREENEKRRIDSDNLCEELRKIIAENELFREKSAAYLALNVDGQKCVWANIPSFSVLIDPEAARYTSTPIVESEETEGLLAHPSPMPPSLQPGPVEPLIAQQFSPAQSAEHPPTQISLSPSSNDNAMR